MEDNILEQLKYPIGQAVIPNTILLEDIKKWTKILEEFPIQLEALVLPLTEEQLQTPYRPGGWTVRQLLYHIGDSHHHSYTRFKWALAEDRPVIKAYEEKDWAELKDAKQAPIRISLDYIKALHAKLVYMIKTLSETDLKRVFIHPEGNKEVSLKANIGMYAWHSQHHFAHIKNLIDREGW